MASRQVRKKIIEREREKVAELVSEIEDEEPQIERPKKKLAFDLLMESSDEEEEEEEDEEEEIEKEIESKPDEKTEIIEKEKIGKSEEKKEIIEESESTEQSKESSVPKFSIGQEVWRKGHVYVVVAIDESLIPPSYTVQVKGQKKRVETEEHLLTKYIPKKRKKKRKKRKSKNLQTRASKDEKKIETPAWFELLRCNAKRMNADEEMIRKFGRAPLSEEEKKAKRLKQHRAYQLHRKTSITRPKPNWMPLRVAGKGGGLYMSIIEQNEHTGESSFRLHFNDDYERQQNEYKARASTMDPHVIQGLLQTNHYHVDTLLTMSEMLMRTNQSTEAVENVEKALFRVECAFHGKFDLSSGRSRLPFHIVENQMVYVALQKHIKNIGRRSCWQSTFECSKFLLSLDPIQDPMFALLTLDYYALQAKQYEWLINFSKLFTFQKCNLRLYPNFAFNVAIARKRLNENEDLVSTEEIVKDLNTDSNKLSGSMCLQQAILLFPELIGPLLHKCKPEFLGQEDWKKIFEHKYFLESKLRREENSTIRKLVEVYVERNHKLWNPYAMLNWLRKNCTKVLERLDNDDELLMLFTAIRLSVYSSALPSRFRALDVTEFSDTIHLIPQDERPNVLPQFNARPNIFRGQNIAQAFLNSLLPWNQTSDLPQGPPRQDNFDMDDI